MDRGRHPSPDGHCRPFDAEANGTVFGSGAAAVLIKPLADACADGDRIPAVVLGSAVNNDGSDKVCFGAPSLAGQAAVIADALVQAGVAPAEVGYVEAHGTGTLLGDPVEVAALAEAYAAVGDGTARAEPTWLGSVKGNVGHLGPLAGMAGLVKAALALDREQLPPTANLREPNPRLRLAGTPFALLRELRDWPRDPAAPRRAAVSSLGIGGTNAHVVLGEGPPADPPAPDEQWQLLVWSGRDERAADAVAGRLAAALGRPGTGPLADVAATLQHGRAALPVRRALVARDRADALAALTDPAHMARAVAGRGLVLPGPLADERAGFAALAQRCPRYAQAVDKWLAAEPGAVRDEWEGAAPWTAAAAVGARVALGRVWLEAGADPATLTGIGPGQVAADLLAARNAGPPVATGPAPADLLSGHPVPTEPAPDDLRRRHLAALGELWTSGADARLGLARLPAAPAARGAARLPVRAGPALARPLGRGRRGPAAVLGARLAGRHRGAHGRHRPGPAAADRARRDGCRPAAGPRGRRRPPAARHPGPPAGRRGRAGPPGRSAHRCPHGRGAAAPGGHRTGRRGPVA